MNRTTKLGLGVAIEHFRQVVAGFADHGGDAAIGLDAGQCDAALGFIVIGRDAGVDNVARR